MPGLSHSGGRLLHSGGKLRCECCNVVKLCSDLTDGTQFIKPDGSSPISHTENAVLTSSCPLPWVLAGYPGGDWTNDTLPPTSLVARTAGWVKSLGGGLSYQTAFSVECIDNSFPEVELQLRRSGGIVYFSKVATTTLHHIEILADGKWKIFATLPIYDASDNYVCDVESRVNYP